MNEKSFDWGAEESSFPKGRAIEPWEFYTNPSNEQGESEVLQVRVDPSLARRIDELVVEAMSQGLPIKTKSHLLRFGIMRGVEELYLRLSSLKSGGDESIAHWLLLEKEAKQVAYRSEMLGEVKRAIRGLTTGLEVLVHKDQQDWFEARDRLTQFLIPVLSMAGDQDFLMGMYIRSLFGFKPFQIVLATLEENNASGSVIRNAKSAYEKITGRGERE